MEIEYGDPNSPSYLTPIFATCGKRINLDVWPDVAEQSEQTFRNVMEATVAACYDDDVWSMP